ncbi:SDR family oxidoreductase [Enterobacter cloacae]|uniref:SDR family oxidoreductase n=1 Tax=Enterobacter cloacae TaxID=550 RepID=UPI0037094545
MKTQPATGETYPKSDLFNKAIPLRRLGKCDEVANTVVYLGSTASSYIVGQTIVIDGGLVMR